MTTNLCLRIYNYLPLVAKKKKMKKRKKGHLHYKGIAMGMIQPLRELRC